MIQIECKECGKIFDSYPSLKRKYCSKKCLHKNEEFRKRLSEDRKGKPHPFSEQAKKNIRQALRELYEKRGYVISPETREKMRQSLIGKKHLTPRHHTPHTEIAKKKIGDANRGKIRTELVRKKMSEAHIMTEEIRQKIRESRIGIQCNFYRDGRDKFKHGGRLHKQWSKKVKDRDGWICQKCHDSSKRMAAHHIKNWIDYPALRYVIDNGITLCDKDHRILESIIAKNRIWDEEIILINFLKCVYDKQRRSA